MEDLAFYNQGCKALSLLITIFAKVVIYRLLTFGPLGLLSRHTHLHTQAHAHTHTHTHTLGNPRAHATYKQQVNEK